LLTLCWVVVLLPGLGRLRVASGLADLMPTSGPEQRALVRYLRAFASSGPGYVLVRGGTHAQRLEFAGRLRSELEGEPGLGQVRWGLGDGRLRDLGDPFRAIDLADAQGMEAIRSRLSPHGLRERAAALRTLLATPLAADLRAEALEDPFGLREIMGRGLARDLGRVHGGDGSFSSDDGEALLVQVDEEPGGEGAAGFVETVRAGLERAAVGSQGLELGLTGAPAHASQIAAAARRDVMMVTVASFGTVLLLVALSFRNLLSLLTIGGVLALAGAASFGAAGYLYGELSPLAVAAVGMVMGLGVDPAVHLWARVVEEARQRDTPAAVRAALLGILPPLSLSALTTVIALLVVAAGSSGALRTMALLAVLGIAQVLLLSLTLLPAMWMLFPRSLVRATAPAGPWTARLADLLRGHRAFVLAAFGVSTLVALPGVSQVVFDGDLRRFDPVDSEAARVDRALEEHFGSVGRRLLVLLEGPDLEPLLSAGEAWADALRPLVDDGRLQSVESPAPVLASRRRAAINREKYLEFGGPPLADSARTALVEAGFRTEAFEAFLTRLAAFGPAARPTSVPPWARELGEKHLRRSDGGWLLAIGIRPPAGAPMPGILAQLEDLRPRLPAAQITGLSTVEAELQEELPRAVRRMVLLVSFAIVALLFAYLRSAREVLLIALPMAVGALLFAGVLGHSGLPFSLFTVPLLALFLGIGLDDHVYLGFRLRDGVDLGAALAAAGRPVILTTLTTVAGFAALCLSSFQGLREMGAMTVLGLLIFLATALLLLPAWRGDGSHGGIRMD
jgi:predicted RND superfamily exporter protein